MFNIFVMGMKSGGVRLLNKAGVWQRRLLKALNSLTTIDVFRKSNIDKLKSLTKTLTQTLPMSGSRRDRSATEGYLHCDWYLGKPAEIVTL